jgi:hypothetical protein
LRQDIVYESIVKIGTRNYEEIVGIFCWKNDDGIQEKVIDERCEKSI